jgi:hypothetical protein
MLLAEKYSLSILTVPLYYLNHPLPDRYRECGFELEDEIWQNENVSYGSCGKTRGSSFKIT